MPEVGGSALQNGRMHWIVVYDFATQWFNPYDWPHVPIGLVAILIGALLIRNGDIRGIFVVALGCFIAIGLSISLVQTYGPLSRAYHHRTYQVAEGIVENFQSICDGKHGEKFDVGGVSFFYADARVHLGFRQTACSGGPMRGGQFVRIWHVQLPRGTRHILRIEIRS
jgi:hypothetical protein